MVDPTDVIRYDRNDAELEEFLLFGVAVAGKTAKTIAKQLILFFDICEVRLDVEYRSLTPFELIRGIMEKGELCSALKQSKLGQYGKLEKSFSQLVEKSFDLRTCTIDDLESIHGIGSKTARYFLMYTRPNQRVAVLDTHILKYIAEHMEGVPRNTPAKKKYKELEEWFINHCEELGVNIAEYDLQIWNNYAKP